jgi:hypothetical protein
MRAVTKNRLSKILKKHMGLQDPRFVLHNFGGRLSGSVIDDRFVGLGDLQRQRLIWDALQTGFGPDAARFVGTLLAYTNSEWNMPLEGRSRPRARKAG